MLTYTSSLTLYQHLTGNQETINTTLFGYVFNEKIRKIVAKRKWLFTQATKDITTVAAQQFYDQPFNLKEINNVIFTVDTTIYSPRLCPDRQTWDALNMTPQSSDIPDYWFPFNKQIGFYPKPASASNTITVNYRKRVKDLSVADYITGSITNTNGDATITGAGTTFTAAMVGRWIKLGDGEWYEIDSFTDATHLELVNTFNGTTAASVSYIIGETSIIPEEYQILPIYGAVADYYSKEGDATSAVNFETKFVEGLKQMENDLLFNVTDPLIESNDVYPTNPNLYITQ